jgi:PAS domain-containing protein
VHDDAHAALALVEAQVGPLFDVLPVPLLLADDRGVVQRVNGSATALLGEAGSLIGRFVFEVLPLDVDVQTRRTHLRDQFQELWLYALPSDVRLRRLATVPSGPRSAL